MNKKLRAYQNVLEHIRCKDKYSGWKSNCFNAYGKTMAVNWRAMAVLPCKLAEYPNHEDKIIHFYPIKINCDETIKTSDLRRTIKNLTSLDYRKENLGCYLTAVILAGKEYPIRNAVTILLVAEMLSAKNIKLVGWEKNKPSLFIIQDVELITMPVYQP